MVSYKNGLLGHYRSSISVSDLNRNRWRDYPLQYAFHKSQLAVQVKAQYGFPQASNLILRITLLVTEELSPLFELI